MHHQGLPFWEGQHVLGFLDNLPWAGPPTQALICLLWSTVFFSVGPFSVCVFLFLLQGTWKRLFLSPSFQLPFFPFSLFAHTLSEASGLAFILNTSIMDQEPETCFWL